MDAFITALTDSTSGLTPTTIWGAFTAAVPLIVPLFVVGVGFFIVRKVLKRGSRLKGGI